MRRRDRRHPDCWGDDTWGQSTLPAGIGTVTQISAGTYNTCAVETDGTPICWGDNGDGQNTIPAGIGTVTQIVVGEWHTCAIKTDGTPICWGRNAPIGPRPSLPPGIGPVTEISAGLYHTCAIKADETVICWGSHIDGQLGGSPTIDSPPPPALVGAGPISHTYTAEPAMGGFGAGNLVIRFVLASGAFPPGVTLNEATGVLAGTPTADGTYTGVVSATNDVFSPADQAFSVTVDTTAPAAPSGLAASPASPSSDLNPRILGTAEPGSTVRLYDNGGCTGAPRASGSAAALASPGLQIAVTTGSTTTVYATATDAAGNTSGCSASKATYVNAVEPMRDPGGTVVILDSPGRVNCVVPRLAGKTLARARTALTTANCKLGTVHRPKRWKARRLGPLVVRSSTPKPEMSPADGMVDLRLGPKPKRPR